MFIKPSNFPSNKKVLYCCLNWGLGHATRSIPIIEKLLEEGNAVAIASDGLALQFLKNQFPDLPSFDLAPYDITYPYSSLLLNVAFQSLKIYSAVNKEYKQINTIIQKNAFDLIISDNRIGCHHQNIPSIYITHQLSPFHKNHLVKYFLHKIHHFYYKKFDSIWVPDDAEVKLSGDLSNYTFLHPEVQFIGIISRLKKTVIDKKYWITVLLSGPEPQRTYLENSLYDALIGRVDIRVCFVRGTNQKNEKIVSSPSIEIHDLLSTAALEHVMNASNYVISRSGYTTLMDLYMLDLDALLIPTPGQTEQEYLAQFHAHRWPFIDQKDLGNHFSSLLLQHGQLVDNR